nr:hypothetical protein [Angustibacter aerolatus]
MVAPVAAVLVFLVVSGSAAAVGSSRTQDVGAARAVRQVTSGATDVVLPQGFSRSFGYQPVVAAGPARTEPGARRRRLLVAARRHQVRLRHRLPATRPGVRPAAAGRPVGAPARPLGPPRDRPRVRRRACTAVAPATPAAT